MPRSSGVAKKRTKAAKARNNYVKRCKILQSIENAEDFVPEDAHLQFYDNLPEVDLPELCIEVENCAPPILPSLRGNRVVDINYLIEQVRKIGVHDCSCTQGKMLFHTECRVGLISHLTYQCDGCEQKMVVKTQNCNNDLNNSFVWGISSVGGGYSQAEELFSVIDVPIMSKKTYKLKEENLCSKWEELLSQQMHQYAMEEKALAIAAGQIEQGIPYITVIVDGGWAKRSYGHSYSSLFYRNTDLKTKAILYGIENEKVAIQKFTQLLEINVADCGLFICKDHCFLGASPDGITSNNELVEVKCLYSIKHLKIKQAAKDNRTLCVTINDSNELMLKQRHHYYFQIQGQLNICQKNYCYLILYTDVDLQYLKIKRDQNFWENIMIPKLLQFWEGCALPELADPRIPRGLNCRDNSK